jgi:signal transduction histidine kinase
MKGSHGEGLVFVVDDDESVRESIESFIRSARLKVKAFASAEEFLRSKGPDIPACVVLYVRLPGMSGLDLQRRLAQSGIEIPIIFITGVGDIRMGVHAMKAGAVEFLTKPFSDQDLIEAVQQGIERDRVSRQGPPQCTDAESSVHQATQEELNRLAGEIHDGLAQHLSAIYMRLAVAREVLSATGSNPICSVDQAIELVNLGLAEARRCAHNLRSRAINESALGLELQRLTERWSINDRWRCHFNSDNIPESKISSWAKHQLLRIAQEAIQNAARHANPTLIAITLRWRAPNLVLKVTDDGTGIPAHRLKNCEGFGLQNMRKRVQDMSGKFEMQTATGRGTSIIVTVPI